MSSFFKSMFSFCAIYCSTASAVLPSQIPLASFLRGEQFACVRAQLKTLNPCSIPISTILLEMSRQREMRNIARESSFRKTLAVVGAVFGGFKWFSGVLFSGAMFMRDSLSMLASFLSKDTQLGAFAVVTAGGFMYLRGQVAQVRTTQENHTNRLQGLQESSSVIISTQGRHGEQLGSLEVSARGLNEGQERLEKSVGAARTLLDQLCLQVGTNGEIVQDVRKSVHDLVARLRGVEEGVGALNNGFAGLQSSFNEQHEMQTLRFAAFETTLSGLSSRVDDGFGKVDELRVLLQESVVKLRTLVAENSGNVEGTIKELQDELIRLTGALDEKSSEMRRSVLQLDENAQVRHTVLREDMQRSVSGLDEKLNQLLAASSPQTRAIQFHPGAVAQSDVLNILYGRKKPQNTVGLPGSSGASTSPSAGFGRRSFGQGSRQSQLSSAASGELRSLTYNQPRS